MAKFISINSSGAGLAGGDILVGVDLITGVEQASATTVVIYLAGGAAANPGGVKAKVHLPEGIEVSGVVFS